MKMKTGAASARRGGKKSCLGTRENNNNRGMDADTINDNMTLLEDDLERGSHSDQTNPSGHFVTEISSRTHDNNNSTSGIFHGEGPLHINERIPDGTPTRTKSISRRRGLGHNNSQFRGIPSSPTSSTTTASTASTPSTQLQRCFSASNNGRSETIEEETKGNSGGLMASLDAGMARVRRWIRSRPPTITITTETQSGAYS
jgi:hypothetical protein